MSASQLQFAWIGRLAGWVSPSLGSGLNLADFFRLGLQAEHFRRLTVIVLLFAVWGAFSSGLHGLQLVSEQTSSEVLLEELAPKAAEAERDFDKEIQLFCSQGVCPGFCSAAVTRTLCSASGFCRRGLLCLGSRGPPSR